MPKLLSQYSTSGIASISEPTQEPQQASQNVLLFPKDVNLQGIDGRSQMGSGLPRHVHASAHDWRQVLTFEGQSCSHFASFTSTKLNEAVSCLHMHPTLVGCGPPRGHPPS